MQPNEPIFDPEYVTSKTDATSPREEPNQSTDSVGVQLTKEAETYKQGKPYRIVTRARIVE